MIPQTWLKLELGYANGPLGPRITIVHPISFLFLVKNDIFLSIFGHIFKEVVHKFVAITIHV